MKTNTTILLACLACFSLLGPANAQSPADPAEAIHQRVAAKVERVKDGAHQWEARGRDTSAIATTMQEKVKPLLEAGKFSEAETEVDRVLEQLKQDGKSTESPTATPASSKAPAMSEKPKYLIFWSTPEKAGELAERIGMKGDGKTRLLGFGLPNPTYELEEQLPSRIRSAFAAAREHDLAVMLHFDFHLHWKKRPDLWNWFDPDKPGYNPDNKYNVEWHGWDGPPNKTSYLNHGVLERMPPSMCLTSKKVRAEITRIVSQVIGPVLREEIAKLKAEGKEILFAGVLVGLEPSIDDYSQPDPERAKMMKEDGVKAGPLGYRALLDRGFSADNPPHDFHRALAEVVQETVAFWCQQFVDAGIPAETLYPHVAAPAPIEVMNAPIWTAFNKYSRPGWTTYAVWVLKEGFKPIYDELEKHGNPAWAGVEANAGFDGSVVDWETYLAWHYNHGCILVGVNTGGTGKDHPKRLRDSAFGNEAIAAYRKFLKGEPLVEATGDASNHQAPKAEASPLMDRLPQKIRTIQKELPAWTNDEARKEKASALMQELKKHLDARDFDAADKTADSILKMIGAKEQPGAQDNPDAARQRVAAKVERVQEGVQEWEASGRDLSAIAKTMDEKVKPLLHAGKFSEAETELDRVLEQLKPNGKVTKSPTAAPANNNAPATSEQPKYLIVWHLPEKAGELAERIGMKGDGKTRLLGFGLPISTYEFEEYVPTLIRRAFSAARAHDLAVMLAFDFHVGWKKRPDLWNWFDADKPGYNPNNKYNVEWHGWDGPPNKTSYLNWGVLERRPPQMCFTSKTMRAEITRIVSTVIRPVLREEIAKLKAEGKEILFAGVLVGSEPIIDDYSTPNPERTKMMQEDGVPAGPLGYRALLDRGFSADHPPDDFRDALAKITQETIAFWCQQFVDAGIPAEKLYPHVVAPAPFAMTNARIWTAFNQYSRPGWTTYSVTVLRESFQAIYDELEKHGSPAWAGVEANAGVPGSVVDWETYLGWHYNHGCVLVGVSMDGTGKDTHTRMRDSAFGKEAIAAYHKFLTGQPLVEKPISMDSPLFRIQAKIKRVRDGIQRWHSSGRDPSAVGKLMQGAQPLANAEKLDELEKLVDHALQMLGETEKVPDVYRKE